MSASLFQQGIDEVLRPCMHLGVGAYMDDIYIFSYSLQEHLSTLELVFGRLLAFNLTVNIKKCQFFK